MIATLKKHASTQHTHTNTLIHPCKIPALIRFHGSHWFCELLGPFDRYRPAAKADKMRHAPCKCKTKIPVHKIKHFRQVKTDNSQKIVDQQHLVNSHVGSQEVFFDPASVAESVLFFRLTMLQGLCH